MENSEINSFNNIEIEEIFKSYGTLVSDAVEIDTNGLIKCFDEILSSFDIYDQQLEQSESTWKNYANILIPNIIEKENELEKVYEKIDSYQLVIKCLKKSFDELEKKMEIAEKEFSSVNKFKKFFNTKLLSSNKSATTPIAKQNSMNDKEKDEFPNIFSHDDVFNLPKNNFFRELKQQLKQKVLEYKTKNGIEIEEN